MKLCYIYAIVASIIVGFHVFSLKYLDISIKTHKNKNMKYYILFFIVITAIITRYLLYKSFQTAKHPAFIQIILNMISIFVVLFLSVFVLNKKVNYLIFTIGSFLIFSGFYIVKKSLY